MYMRQFFKQIVIGLATIALFTACSSNEPGNRTDNVIPDPVLLDQPEVFLDSEQANLMLVFNLDRLDNGDLVIADPGLSQVVVFDPSGTERFRFGTPGRGPGEITSLDNIDIHNGNYYVGDRSKSVIMKFDPDGNFISNLDYRTNRGSFGDFAMLNSETYITASVGENGSLIKWYAPETGESGFWGKAEAEESEGLDMQMQNDYLKRGQVAPADMNNVDVETDGEFVYAYLNGLGRVQKYSKTGKLLWDVAIDIPINNLILEQASARARGISGQGMRASFSLTSSFKIIDEYIYALSFPVEGMARTLIQMDKNGKVTGHYHIPEASILYFDFTVDRSTNTLYLASPELGEIHKVSLR